MKRIFILLILCNFSLVHYGQIIADHTVVDKFDDIPQAYINEVKKMCLIVAGESHSRGYLTGLDRLELLYSTYQVSQTFSGAPESYTSSYLRSSRGMWGDYYNATGWIYGYGEEDWFTNATAISRTKAGITYCNETVGTIISAIGFGWCSDLTVGVGTSGIDPVYGVHWYGESKEGPEGILPIGLDAGDYTITGNSVSVDTYLNATQQYIDYCTSKGYPTKVFFTTGPVDPSTSWYGEKGYQGHIKHEYIRDYVEADPTRIFFDYADILCYDDNGTPTTVEWNGHTYPSITATNGTPIENAHISIAGTIRLGKAMWWMLARMAGWDGGISTIPVTAITVTGAGGSSIITTDNGTLQLTAAIAPTNATNQTVTWTIANGTGQATISPTGLVTAVSNGTVTARATANDGSGIYGTLVITISSQVIPVTGITVTGAGGSSVITTDNGTIQLSAAIAPTNATDQTVTWTISNGTGQATINSTGLVTAISNGTVTARATANDGSGIYGTLVITVSSQVIPVTGITVTGAGGSSVITTDNGTLQLSAAIAPTNVTDQTVIWTISNGTGQATISSTGLVTAISNGTVTARATANDGSGIYGTLVITISSQVIPVTGITVTGAGGSSVITTDNGTLQLSAAIAPTNATDQTVTWTISNGTGQATINSTGLVTAISNGTVTARATANDGSGIYGTLVITISSQVIPVTGITVTGAGGSSVITTDNGTLQLSAATAPTNATNQTVAWTIANGTGQATISPTGLVTAVSNGTVTARATANDGSGIYGTLVITISSQVIPVTGITVTGAGGSSVITTDNGTIQLSAAIAPTNATDQTVTWTISNGTGQATINSTGLVTAISNGTVTARATANDGSGIYGTLVITVSSQVIPVTGITVTGAGGSSVITTDNGTLQLSAAIAPTNVTDQTVIWTISNGTGQATISSTGLVTAISNGTVTARATANDSSGEVGTLAITISNQLIPVTGITVTGAGGSSLVATDNGTLQLTATITPVDATNQAVTWSIVNGTGQATISATGLVTAVSSGIVTAIATINDSSEIYGELAITIGNQVIPVTIITVDSAATNNAISTGGEIDWYRFYTGAAGTYTIQTYGSTDIYMYLYQSDQATIIEEDDDDGQGINSSISQSLNANTWYYVKVRDYYATSTGSYSIDVKGLTAVVTITVDSATTNDAISTGGENDWYRFYTGTAGTYTIQTYGNTDIYMYLYQSDQATIIEEDDDDGQGTNSLISQSLNANTWYYVMVRDYYATLTGSYSIDVKGITAVVTIIVDSAPTNDAISTGGENDWYRFYTGASGTYTIQTYGNTDIYMYLYQSDQTTIIEEDDDDGQGTNSLISQSLNANTWYYVKVRDYYATSTGNYSIDVLNSLNTKSLKLNPVDTQVNDNRTTLEIYPNPATENITVVLPGDINNLVRLEIVSLSGQGLFFKQLVSDKKSTLIINVQELPSGIYVVRVVISDQIMTSKFIKE